MCGVSLHLIPSVADNPRRVTGNNRIVGDIFGDDTAHADDGAVAYGNAIDDASLGAYPDIFAYDDTLGADILLVDRLAWLHAMVEGIDGDIIGDAGLVTYGDANAAAVEGAAVVDGNLIA